MRLGSIAKLILGLRFISASAFQTETLHDKLSDKIQQRFEREHGIGAVAGIVSNGEVIYLEGFGWADREFLAKVDPERTLFRWASVSKTLTGMASIMASFDGKLDLDADIGRYWPEYRLPDSYLPEHCHARDCAKALPAEHKLITQRMLLSHMAGIAHYGEGLSDLNPPEKISSDATQNTGIEWATHYVRANPLIEIPGTQFHYSTFGFNLAGVVLEKALGESFADIVRRRISEPLGLASLQPDYLWAPLKNRAAGYIRNSLGLLLRESEEDVSWKAPGGGFVSTGRDFARYCSALMNDRWLRPELKAELWKNQVPSDHIRYGLGFNLAYRHGQRCVSHNGAQQKTRTLLVLYPEEKLCFVYMTNSAWIDPEDYVDLLESNYRN